MLEGVVVQPHYARAAAEAALEDADAALNRAVSADEPAVVEAAADPWFDPLRGAPRWARLTSRVRALGAGGGG